MRPPRLLRPHALGAWIALCLLTSGCDDQASAEPKDAAIHLLFRHVGGVSATAPGRMVHVDLLLPGGEIRGYFCKSGMADGSVGEQYLKEVEGVVADRAWMEAKRPQYVSIATAKKFSEQDKPAPIFTLQMRIPATTAEVEALRAAWSELEKAPPPYRAIGANCATVLARTLFATGVLKPGPFGGLAGIDRPQTLCEAVRKQVQPEARQEAVVYFGLRPDGAPETEAVGGP